MTGFLFEQLIFGPIRSRRLGISLGVNLLPTVLKHCTFNCIYCECGWTFQNETTAKGLPEVKEIELTLESKLKSMVEKNAMLDSITFAGNGEPTLHPHFDEMVDVALKLRNKYYPEAKVSVLTNASRLAKQNVVLALLRIDQPILKLDAGTEEAFQLINQPNNKVTLLEIVEYLKQFQGKAIIQSLFLKGSHDGKIVDNTSETELVAWLEHLKAIKPAKVMVYSLDRDTPEEKLEKIPVEELNQIAQRVKDAGIVAEVY